MEWGRWDKGNCEQKWSGADGTREIENLNGVVQMGKVKL
jgi:hypothetical protein